MGFSEVSDYFQVHSRPVPLKLIKNDRLVTGKFQKVPVIILFYELQKLLESLQECFFKVLRRVEASMYSVSIKYQLVSINVQLKFLESFHGSTQERHVKNTLGQFLVNSRKLPSQQLARFNKVHDR